jgi:hypothetical protein
MIIVLRAGTPEDGTPNELPSPHLVSPRDISTLRKAIVRKGPSRRTSGMGDHQETFAKQHVTSKIETRYRPSSSGHGFDFSE